MLLPDINLLIYAHNLRAPLHRAAIDWWGQRLNGPEGVALTWVVILGFVRIATHPRIFERPMTVDETLGRVEEWLSLSHVQIVHPAEAHFGTLYSLLKKVGGAGNLTTDAHLAAIAIHRGCTLCSTDSDFAQFPGLKWVNPLKPAG